ncbi:hypothetical protein C3L33_05548, partial [Rhododendron williamsianum]
MIIRELRLDQASIKSVLFSPETFPFVLSGLCRHTTSERLREAFAFFGEVVDARVVTDRVSGYNKGFGFVRYATIEHAAEGIKGMDGKFLDGWAISAVYARPRPPPPGNNAGPPSYQPGYGSQFGQRKFISGRS